MVLRGSVYSRTLEMETGLTVITPNDYGQAEKYRVCYVLHGLCGGNADFSNYTMLPYFAYDKDIIFICPEVQRSIYTDTEYGLKYFTYVSEELVHTAKLVFNISSKREDTAVMGCSMGGYGALKCALSRPDVFGWCGAFAPAFLYMTEYTDECRKNGKVEIPDLYGIFGRDLNCPPEDDIQKLVEKNANNTLKPKIFVTCGKDDFLLDDNRRFAEEMNNSGFDFKYEEIAGTHDFYSFNEGAKKFTDYFYNNSNM